MSKQTYISTKCPIAPGINANFSSSKCGSDGELPQDKVFPTVEIIGGGISGLTVAYEMLRSYHEQQRKKNWR